MWFPKDSSEVDDEAIDIRLRHARSWLRKASGTASVHDIDAQFIFLWIAFNALYGTPCLQPVMQQRRR